MVIPLEQDQSEINVDAVHLGADQLLHRGGEQELNQEVEEAHSDP